MRNAYITKRIAPQGYVAVTKALAREVYELGFKVTVAGNNVNSFHVFSGWHLGCTISILNILKRDPEADNFNDIVNDFMSYLEKELGSYPVFYTRKESVLRWRANSKTRCALLDFVSSPRKKTK